MIEDFFRENRIREIDYQSKALEKLQDNILIAEPYSSGKGFIQSNSLYLSTSSANSDQKQALERALSECDYLAIIKKVNKIFFQNYSGNSSQKTQSLIFSSLPVRICLVLIGILFIFCILSRILTIPNSEYGILAIDLIIIGLLLWISLGSFVAQSNQNYQLS